MQPYRIISHQPAKTYQGHYFHIQSKGLNAGRPLREAMANSFVLFAPDADSLQYWYYLCYALWISRSFRIVLRGSVIEFITIRDLKQVLDQHHQHFRRTPQQLNKLVAQLQTIEQLEVAAAERLSLLKQLKHSMLYSYINK